METSLKVVALVPAHNEAEQIADTILALQAQTRPLDRIVIVADNCTDETAQIARSLGVEVLATVENKARKAGALNQGYALVEPTLADSDTLLCIDADTLLEPEFVANALRHLGEKQLAAVGATFVARPAQGRGFSWMLSLMQQMEYEHYRGQVVRRRGRTRVLSGAATLFTLAPLRALHADRGYLYDETSIVEDFELTLALKQRGLTHLSPPDCRISTEVMPTLRKLWHQRVRWHRGTLDEVRKYGFSRLTAFDYFCQMMLSFSVLMRAIFLTASALALVYVHSYRLSWLWLGLALFIAVERAVGVRRLGPAALAASLLVVPENLYALLLECSFVRSLWLHTRNRSHIWHTT
jgi:cellulose synthase/poly-beta-1,6-N-acetylglucosamine synthase-like glycosyltransferase